MDTPWVRLHSLQGDKQRVKQKPREHFASSSSHLYHRNTGDTKGWPENIFLLPAPDLKLSTCLLFLHTRVAAARKTHPAQRSHQS